MGMSSTPFEMSDLYPDKPRRNETNLYATHVDHANWSSLTSENWRDKIRNAKFPEGSGVTMTFQMATRDEGMHPRKESLRKYVQDSDKKIDPRLRELAPGGQRESGGGIHAT